MPRRTVRRDVYFFRADIGKDESGKPLSFDPTSALDKIGNYHLWMVKMEDTKMI